MDSRITGYEENYQDTARRLVMQYFNRRREVTDKFTMVFEDTYVVWFSKTLKNWKALVSTNVPDGMYYEVTYNGEKMETYIDAYKKFENVVIRGGVIPPAVQEAQDKELVTDG
jgi:Family of unknown function (DUF6275)